MIFQRLAAEKIKDDLNQQVRKWGIDIREVSLSDARLLKKPEEAGLNFQASQ